MKLLTETGESHTHRKELNYWRHDFLSQEYERANWRNTSSLARNHNAITMVKDLFHKTYNLVEVQAVQGTVSHCVLLWVLNSVDFLWWFHRKFRELILSETEAYYRPQEYESVNLRNTSSFARNHNAIKTVKDLFHKTYNLVEVQAVQGTGITLCTSVSLEISGLPNVI